MCTQCSVSMNHIVLKRGSTYRELFIKMTLKILVINSWWSLRLRIITIQMWPGNRFVKCRNEKSMLQQWIWPRKKGVFDQFKLKLNLFAHSICSTSRREWHTSIFSRKIQIILSISTLIIVAFAFCLLSVQFNAFQSSKTNANKHKTEFQLDRVKKKCILWAKNGSHLMQLEIFNLYLIKNKFHWTSN